MAVPTSGAISMRGVAKERRYNDVGVDGYTSGSTANLTNISMYDLMRGGNTNGSDYNFCPPMTNEWPQTSGPNLRQPYDPALQQGTGYLATPYAMSEFRGHVGNRELGCAKLDYGACFPTGNQSASYPSTYKIQRWDFALNYTPQGSGAIIYMEINQSWAGLSTSSSTTGAGSQTLSFTATTGTTTRYLNIAPNTSTSSRSLLLQIYISGSCYSSNNLLHNLTITQAGASGGGGGGGLPPKPGGGSQ